MNLYIGENIKRLRKEKNITQEKLAEYLNISCQAISKWERNEAYPDITMVIPLASFFGVSTDELLGVDNAKNEEKIQEYLKEYKRFGNLGEERKKQELITQAYIEFPNDFRIIDLYIYKLAYDIDCQMHGIIEHKDELIHLCNRILDECTIDDVRYDALDILADIYFMNGQRQLAEQTVNRLPWLYYNKTNRLAYLYDASSPERLMYTRKSIGELIDNLVIHIRNIALEDKSLSTDEAIQTFEKAISLIMLIYSDGDYGFFDYYLGDLYIWIANRYIIKGDYLKAIEYVDKGLSHSMSYDYYLKNGLTHTSTLVRGNVLDNTDISSGGTGNQVWHQLEYINIKCKDLYEPLRENDDFLAAIEKYKPYAKEEK